MAQKNSAEIESTQRLAIQPTYSEARTRENSPKEQKAHVRPQATARRSSLQWPVPQAMIESRTIRKPRRPATLQADSLHACQSSHAQTQERECHTLPPHAHSKASAPARSDSPEGSSE